MLVTHPWRREITILTFVVIAATLIISCVRWIQEKLVFEQLRDRYQSRQTLVHYVQLRHQCGEETAYRHLVAFLKKHVSRDEYPSIEYMAVHARQSLLEEVHTVIRKNPSQIDEI